MSLDDIARTPFGRPMRRHFLLEEGIAFLNHGSYGATPRLVLDAAESVRRRVEAQPCRFMNQALPGRGGLLRRSGRNPVELCPGLAGTRCCGLHARNGALSRDTGIPHRRRNGGAGVRCIGSRSRGRQRGPIGRAGGTPLRFRGRRWT